MRLNLSRNLERFLKKILSILHNLINKIKGQRTPSSPILAPTTPKPPPSLTITIQQIEIEPDPPLLSPRDPLFKLALEQGDIKTVKKTLDKVHNTLDLRRHHHFFDCDLYELGAFSIYSMRRFSLPHVLHTPLSYAIAFSPELMVHFLLEEAHSKLSSEIYEEVLKESLIAACHFDRPSLIEYCFCLQQKHAPKMPLLTHMISSLSGLNPLQTAAYKSNLAAIAWLLEHQTDINYRGHSLNFAMNSARTALFFALSSKSNKETKEESVLFFLNNGAKLDFCALEAMERTQFVLNFEKIYTPIECIYDTATNLDSYQPLLDKIEAHNKILIQKTIEHIEQTTDLPPVLSPVIYSYLSSYKLK